MKTYRKGETTALVNAHRSVISWNNVHKCHCAEEMSRFVQWAVPAQCVVKDRQQDK